MTYLSILFYNSFGLSMRDLFTPTNVDVDVLHNAVVKNVIFELIFFNHTIIDLIKL